MAAATFWPWFSPPIDKIIWYLTLYQLSSNFHHFTGIKLNQVQSSNDEQELMGFDLTLINVIFMNWENN